MSFCRCLPVSTADLNDLSTATSVASVGSERDTDARLKVSKKIVNEGHKEGFHLACCFIRCNITMD